MSISDAGPPPDLENIASRLAAERLEIFGAFEPRDAPDLPAGTRSLLLVGPAEPGFWNHVSAAPEFADTALDPLDRWSDRILTTIAAAIGATAVFPFGGPPYRPFIAWALASGRAWTSPVGLLVHDSAGLMVSFRGALALPYRLDLPPAVNVSPCDACHRPCLSGCPVGALAGAGYDLDACHGYLDTDAGQGCLGGGCLVRRACPVSQSYGRRTEQSAFHMRAFHR